MAINREISCSVKSATLMTQEYSKLVGIADRSSAIPAVTDLITAMVFPGPLK
ncbi:MAG: hypothetical protein PHC39_09400 [Proteiniphilum sp.]|nr:hypothetical protein [Proteiniphilum sp.]